MNFRVALLASAMFLPGVAQADLGGSDAAPPGEAITVTATRIPARVIDVPATVTVIEAEQIADEMVSDIRDLVRFEPGVSVRRQPSRFGAALGSTGRDGNSGVNIRGIEGNRVLIQVDGIRVPDGFGFGAQLAGRGDYVDLGLVKSVEILRGPASALYGSDGLAGAVSFVTSDPEDFLGLDRDFAGLLRGVYDSADEQFTTSAVGAARAGRWSILAAFTRRDGKELDNQGENEAPNSTRTAPNPQDTRSNAALGKIVFAPDEANRIRLTVDHNASRVRTDVLSGIVPVASAPTSVIGLFARDTNRRDRVSLDWRREGDGLIEYSHMGVWYQDGENLQFTAEDRLTAADRERLNTFENRVIGASAELRAGFGTGAVRHRLAFGGDISVTRQKGLRDGTVPPVGETFPTAAFPKTDFTLAGLYLADEIIFADGAVSLYPALRFDHYDLNPKDDPLLPAFQGSDQDGSRLSPKLGARVRVGGGAALFANYARGFKAPSPGQVNNFFGNPIQNYESLPNPELRPETSETVEGGVRLEGRGFTAGITGFSGRYRDFISQELVGGTFTPADPGRYQFVNLARAKIEGVEARLDALSPSGITGRFSVAYAKGDVTDGAGVTRPLASVDPLKLVAGVGYRDPDNRFGGEVILTHSMAKEDSRAVGACAATCFIPDGFTILDATAFARIGQALTLRAGLFNITDAKYAWWADVRGLPATSTVTDAYTQPGRNLSVSLTARF